MKQIRTLNKQGLHARFEYVISLRFSWKFDFVWELCILNFVVFCFERVVGAVRFPECPIIHAVEQIPIHLAHRPENKYIFALKKR